MDREENIDLTVIPIPRDAEENMTSPITSISKHFSSSCVNDD